MQALTNSLAATAKSVNTQVTSNMTDIKNNINSMNAKLKGGTTINKILIIAIAVFIIVMAVGGVVIKKNCSLESANINKKIIEFFTGFGSGMLIYAILDILNIASIPVIMLLSLFLSIYGSILVYSVNHLGANCEKTDLIRELSMGLLGAGIGMLYYASLNVMMNLIKGPITKGRVIALMSSIFLIIIPSVILNFRQKCKKESTWVDATKDKNITTGSAVGLTIGSLITIGILISFRFISSTL
jgi:hypothetical protein